MNSASTSSGLLQSVQSVLRYGRPYARPLIVIAMLSCLDVGLSAQVALCFKFLIDEVIPQKDGRMLAFVVAGLIVSITLVARAGIYRDRLYAGTVARMVAGLRMRLFEQLQSLTLSYFSRNNSGDILARFSNDLIELETTYLSGVPWGVIPILDLMVSAALVFTLDWRLAALALVALPFALAGPKLLVPRTVRAAYERKVSESGLISLIQQNLSAQPLVKAFGLRQRATEDFRRHNQEVENAALRSGFLTLLMERSSTSATQVLQLIVLAAGGFLTYRGEMSIGTFAACQAFFATIASSLASIGEYLPEVVHANGGIARIEEVLSQKSEMPDSRDADKLPDFAHNIAFKGVGFGYTQDQKVLDAVTLSITRGQSVAFVGPSGSGKSTVLTLLMRFYDPWQGSVLVDGHDLRTVSEHSWRAQTAIVLQENFLFNTTIRENISIVRPDASDEEVETAARGAGIHDFISSLPDGYQTMAGGSGGRFSGGQKQRIAIARALLRNPPILVLDEATSALDSTTEAQINDTIERVGKGRTVLSVTHRLASAIRADQIYYLEKGNVVEHGTHLELLASQGAYSRMWKKQTGLLVGAEGEPVTISLDRLREIPILAGLAREVLEEISRSFISQQCSTGQILINEGEAGDRFYILARGSVEVVRGAIRVAVLQDGDYFGETSLLLNVPTNATVRALAECSFLVLPRDKFLALIERAPSLRWKMRESASISSYRREETMSPADEAEISQARTFRHDFLNELNCVIGYSEILVNESGPQEGGILKSRFQAIRDGASSAHVLIDNQLSPGLEAKPGALRSLREKLLEPAATMSNSLGMALAEASPDDVQQFGDDLTELSGAIAKLHALLGTAPSPGHAPRNGSLSAGPWLNVAGTDKRLSKGHLLVVDDNDAGRTLLCRSLAREGYQVSAAPGGETALAMVENLKLDLILLDIIMPGIDGFEVLRRLRASGHLSRVPVIVISALDEVKSRVECIELGAEDFLTKPFEVAMLRARIEATIEKRRLAGLVAHDSG